MRKPPRSSLLSPGRSELRIAVVSPFLDRRHGTERCIVEQIERFVQRPDCEIHIYAQSIKDLDVVPWGEQRHSPNAKKKAIWHRVPTLPGPHLLNFLWWYFANQSLRWFHRAFRKLDFDLIYSPGINCSDAGAIAVHVVFHEYFHQVHAELRLRAAPLFSWPIIFHRLLYYRLIMALENRIYRDSQVRLAAVSKLTASELATHFGRQDVTVIPNAVDLGRFSVPGRLQRRKACRMGLSLSETELGLLLIGNDWKSKGLITLLHAVAANRHLDLKVLVVGRDNRAPFDEQIRRLDLGNRVLFLEPSPDVMQFYAAADVYAGPSLHDSFALPPLEAMACGLPVITSTANGGSQIITEGHDGFVLADPEDSAALGRLIERLYKDSNLRSAIGENAARTAQSYTWERNAAETWEFFAMFRTAVSRNHVSAPPSRGH